MDDPHTSSGASERMGYVLSETPLRVRIKRACLSGKIKYDAVARKNKRTYGVDREDYLRKKRNRITLLCSFPQGHAHSSCREVLWSFGGTWSYKRSNTFRCTWNPVRWNPDDDEDEEMLQTTRFFHLSCITVLAFEDNLLDHVIFGKPTSGIYVQTSSRSPQETPSNDVGSASTSHGEEEKSISETSGLRMSLLFHDRKPSEVRGLVTGVVHVKGSARGMLTGCIAGQYDESCCQFKCQVLKCEITNQSGK